MDQSFAVCENINSAVGALSSLTDFEENISISTNSIYINQHFIFLTDTYLWTMSTLSFSSLEIQS